jgi:heme/copper-type cytochrome/quinol oxidase subunit 4
MNPDCPSCGVHFERENGYFMGAIWIAYGMGVFTLIPTVVVMLQHYEAEFPIVVGVATAQLLLLHPLIYFYSRTIWMYIDRSGAKKDWH